MKAESKKLKTGFPHRCLDSRFAVSGQPALEDLPALKGEGFSQIVNVRGFQEMESAGFKGGAKAVSKAMEDSRLSYHHIPVIKDGALSREALEEIHQILSPGGRSGKEEAKKKSGSGGGGGGGAKTLIHCASGQRAVIALLHHLMELGELPLDSAAALAHDLGLRGEALLIKLFQTR